MYVRYVEALQLDANQAFIYNNELYVVIEIVCDPSDVIQNVVVRKLGLFRPGTSTPISFFLTSYDTENFNPYQTVRLVTDWA